ncbi:hypothetical protein EVAR_30596_1 [Eumeta japonica]|uniref:Uncharacterized protein n=1 Tax=Eumeta variegata TaxID=151549 RepID=A0A4C1W818_EUMVA|nr:hypothetical protein EVAR_30596_1 [Eumeta japonica]
MNVSVRRERYAVCERALIGLRGDTRRTSTESRARGRCELAYRVNLSRSEQTRSTPGALKKEVITLYFASEANQIPSLSRSKPATEVTDVPKGRREGLKARTPRPEI